MKSELAKLIDQAGLHRLFRFWLAAERGTYTAAARWVGINSTTFAESIRRLENDINVRLFEKQLGGDHRRLQPTPEGIILAQLLEPMFTGIARALAITHQAAKLRSDIPETDAAA